MRFLFHRNWKRGNMPTQMFMSIMCLSIKTYCYSPTKDYRISNTVICLVVGGLVFISIYYIDQLPSFRCFSQNERNSDISMLLSYFQIDWSHTWNEFSEPARVVEKGVQIFIKDINKRKKLSGLFGSADQSKVLLITDYNIKQVRISTSCIISQKYFLSIS